jgi:hypothetical protein
MPANRLTTDGQVQVITHSQRNLVPTQCPINGGLKCDQVSTLGKAQGPAHSADLPRWFVCIVSQIIT